MSQHGALQTLEILILSDGRPGHYHLAEGVAAAIARRRPVTVVRRPVGRPRWLPGRALAGLVALDERARPVLLRLVGLAGDLPRAGLVISAGGETLAANIAAARQLGVPNIFCGTLRRVAPERLSLVVSSYARHAALPRHLVALKPSGFDPDTLPVGRLPEFKAGQPPGVAGLLIGGDSGHFRYGHDEWQRLVDFIEESRIAYGTRWIVSTSRRSPDFVADRVAAVASRHDGPIEEFIDFRHAGPGTLPRLFAAVDSILCTEDSSTMLSEAVCARLPVVGVSPRIHQFKDEEAEYRAFMRDQGWCRFVPLSELTPGRFVEALAEVKPLAENHLEKLVAALADRLPELFP